MKVRRDVSISDARKNLPSLVRDAERGLTVTLTRRGEAVAVLISTDQYQAYAKSLTVLGYDDAAAAWHASERARLTGSGKTPSFVDGQIAAIARVNALVLVTANVRHYESFEGLTIEDWRSS